MRVARILTIFALLLGFSVGLSDPSLAQTTVPGHGVDYVAVTFPCEQGDADHERGTPVSSEDACCHWCPLSFALLVNHAFQGLERRASTTLPPKEHSARSTLVKRDPPIPRPLI
jgi:hypothetical protein